MKRVLFSIGALLLVSALVVRSQTNISAPSPVTVSGALPAGTNVLGHVIVDTAPSTAVTNAGTFAVQQTASGLNPCANPNVTLLQNSTTTSGTSLTQFIAASGSTKIYICNFAVLANAGTNPTITLTGGTGSNCASTQTTILVAIPIVTTALFNFGPQFSVVPASDALCYTVGGTVSPVAKFSMSYVQQ